MLIDVSYFTSGPRHIVNATATATTSQNSLSVNAAIVGYIRHYQLAFLCEMLGDSLAVEIDDYLNEKEQAEKATNGQTAFEPVARFELLCSKLRDSFADYVFFYLMRDAGTQATERGVVIWKNENTVVSPLQRQVSVWNEMVNRNVRFKAWAAIHEPSVSVSSNMTSRVNPYNL